MLSFQSISDYLAAKAILGAKISDADVNDLRLGKHSYRVAGVDWVSFGHYPRDQLHSMMKSFQARFSIPEWKTLVRCALASGGIQ